MASYYEVYENRTGERIDFTPTLDMARKVGVIHLKGTRSVHSLTVYIGDSDKITGVIQRGRLGNEWINVWHSVADKRLRRINPNGTLGDYFTTAEVRQLLTESNVVAAKRISKKRNIPEYVAYGKIMSKQRGKFEKVYKEKY